jgi:CRP/FNR family transcriptional regulator, cyclic AMP receptor protein
MGKDGANSELIETLSGNRFFAAMPQDYLTFMAGASQRKRFKAGEVLFRQGEHADRFFLVQSGEITVEVPAIMGPALQLQKLSNGKLLGWSWLIAPYRWDFQARAITDAEVIEFDGAAILARCEADNAFGYELFKRFTGLMSERLLAARRKMMDQWDPAGFA